MTGRSLTQSRIAGIQPRLTLLLNRAVQWLGDPSLTFGMTGQLWGEREGRQFSQENCRPSLLTTLRLCHSDSDFAERWVSPIIPDYIVWLRLFLVLSWIYVIVIRNLIQFTLYVINLILRTWSNILFPYFFRCNYSAIYIQFFPIFIILIDNFFFLQSWISFYLLFPCNC